VTRAYACGHLLLTAYSGALPLGSRGTIGQDLFPARRVGLLDPTSPAVVELGRVADRIASIWSELSGCIERRLIV
jgi:hypothetical protein